MDPAEDPRDRGVVGHRAQPLLVGREGRPQPRPPRLWRSTRATSTPTRRRQLELELGNPASPRSMALPFLAVLPVYQGVRSHPRVVGVLERMKLKERGAFVSD